MKALPAAKALLVCAAVVLLGGCALTTSELNVKYVEAAATRGPLGSLPAMNVSVTQFADKRPETGVIGYKRNGYGMKMGKILVTTPVGDIIRDALIAQFVKNGHRAGDSGALKITGDVTTFWFDTNMNLFTIDFIGTVAVNLTATDVKSGTVLYSAAYQAEHKDSSMMGLEGTWERVLNAALEKMVHEIASDIRLVRALRGQSTTAKE